MKYILAALAIAIATPAAAQSTARPADHSQHGQQGHGQHGQPGQSGHGRHQDGQRHDCPCCAPGADGRRPACCERMHQQGGERQQEHGNH
jgi:hypothetical protein